MKHPRALADPVPGRAIEINLDHPLESRLQHAIAGPTNRCAELDRYGIAVVLQAVYEWRDYRYTNASDAIAAAKRAGK